MSDTLDSTAGAQALDNPLNGGHLVLDQTAQHLRLLVDLTLKAGRRPLHEPTMTQPASRVQTRPERQTDDAGRRRRAPRPALA